MQCGRIQFSAFDLLHKLIIISSVFYIFPENTKLEKCLVSLCFLTSYKSQLQCEIVQSFRNSSRWLINSELLLHSIWVFLNTLFIGFVGQRIRSQLMPIFNPNLGTFKILPDLSEQFKINLKESLH